MPVPFPAGSPPWSTKPVMTRWKSVPLKYWYRVRKTKLFTAANDLAASICTTILPTLVVNVASQTEVAGMHLDGAALNSTTRAAEPPAGGQAGATATVVVVDEEVVVEVVVVDALCFELLLSNTTISTT